MQAEKKRKLDEYRIKNLNFKAFANDEFDLQLPPNFLTAETEDPEYPVRPILHLKFGNDKIIAVMQAIGLEVNADDFKMVPEEEIDVIK